MLRGMVGPTKEPERRPCDARIRPLLGDTEIPCERDDDHTEHRGTLHDYAGPGSETVIEWNEGDRRSFHGPWPGRCPYPRCILPRYHRGRCTT